MRRTLFLALAFTLVGLGAQAAAQVQPKGPVPKPQQIYADFRALMLEGKFDVAASFLQAFLNANPSDADLLEIERKYGTTTFTMLRTIPRWSDDAAADKKAREMVEEAIKRARAAGDKLLRDPARVAKYIANLGATYEERVYAELELKRMGDFAVPFMVSELRKTNDNNLYAGLLSAIRVQEGHAIDGWVAALDGLNPQQQAGVLTSIASRPDILKLQTFAQSDLAPFLWKVMASAENNENSALRKMAEDLLRKVNPGVKVDLSNPEVRLTTIARTFYDRTARFSATRTNPDGSPALVPVWVWDAKAETVVKNENVAISQAQEFFGLRYARWALEARPSYELAQALILALAAEKAIERARYGTLATAEPATFQLLAEAPSPILADLLNAGLNRKKTALVLAMVQVLADRADRDAATPPAGTPSRPSLLVRALSYPDPQVQFWAATALLRSPVDVPTEARGPIVDILRRAAGADAGLPANTIGTALLVDPSKTRADLVAHLLHGVGLHVEMFTTGRDLLRRIGHASDFDLILIDRHTHSPLLIDLIGQLHADTKTAARPTFVIASTDKPRVPTFDQLILRFAALIAATELQIEDIPPVYVPDPRDANNPQLIAKERKTAQELRDGAIRIALQKRVDRLRRVIDATGATFSPEQKLLFDLRLDLISAMVLATEYPISPESSPRMAEQLASLREQIARQPASPPYGVGVPTTDLVKLMERFEIDLARVPAAQKRFDAIYAKLDAAELGLPVERFRDEALEARIARSLQNYPAVKIMPEPNSRLELEMELKAAFRNLAQAPRDMGAKKAAQKTAVEWLSKMTTGVVPGYETKSAGPELRAALRVDDLAPAAIPAVARLGTAEAQQDLLALAITPGRPLPARRQAAEAAIGSIRHHGKLIPKSLIDALVGQSASEPDLALRAQLLTLRGILAYDAAEFVNSLKSFNPPLIPPAPPVKDPPVDPKKGPPGDLP